MNSEIDVLTVAEYLLHTAYKCGDCITNLKIQKLLYYAQAWYLVNFNSKLFSNNIEAWQYGPVVQEVYQEYKKFGNKPIDVDIDVDRLLDELSYDQREYLDEFCAEFFKFSATELVSMTHREDPWVNAYNKGQGTVIPTQSMQEYYSKL